MDSEHRHELQQNDLARVAMKTTGFLEQHGTKIVGAIAVAVVIAIVGLAWNLTTSASQSTSWTALAAADTLEDYGSVADRYGDTAAGAWARLRESELTLESGVKLSFRDREAGNADLKRAQEGFQEVIKSSNAVPEARERALFGLGRAEEALSKGDTEPAIAAYKKLVADFPDSIYKTYAQQRITKLETGAAKAFYTWWGQQNPQPQQLPRPADGAAAPAAQPGAPATGSSVPSFDDVPPPAGN